MAMIEMMKDIDTWTMASTWLDECVNKGYPEKWIKFVLLLTKFRDLYWNTRPYCSSQNISRSPQAGSGFSCESCLLSSLGTDPGPFAIQESGRQKESSLQFDLCGEWIRIDLRANAHTWFPSCIAWTQSWFHQPWHIGMCVRRKNEKKKMCERITTESCLYLQEHTWKNSSSICFVFIFHLHWNWHNLIFSIFSRRQPF